MMETHRPGAAHPRHHARKTHFSTRGIHGAAEKAVGGVMIPYRSLVRTGYHQERPILDKGVVQHHTDRQKVVVGMGVKGPVLMPFHRRAMTWLLEIDLGTMQPHAGRTQKLLQD